MVQQVVLFNEMVDHGNHIILLLVMCSGFRDTSTANFSPVAIPTLSITRIVLATATITPSLSLSLTQLLRGTSDFPEYRISLQYLRLDTAQDSASEPCEAS